LRTCRTVANGSADNPGTGPWGLPDGTLPSVPDAPFPPVYKRAVMGLNGGPTDPLVVRVGCEFAKGRAVELIALHVVEVDWRHALDDEISGSNEVASSALDMAEAIAEKYRVKLRTQLLQARDVGAALVDEASELGADVILLGLPYRKHFGGDFAIGSTILYVFQNAPCAVIVIREPVAASEQRRTAVPAGRRTAPS
jgi:nucleotide-binding universal stress UspA family protein